MDLTLRVHWTGFLKCSQSCSLPRDTSHSTHLKTKTSHTTRTHGDESYTIHKNVKGGMQFLCCICYLSLCSVIHCLHAVRCQRDGGGRGEGTSHLANISRPKLPRGEFAFLSGLISTQPFSSRSPTPSIFPRTVSQAEPSVSAHEQANSARATKLLYSRICSVWFVITSFLHLVVIVSAYSCGSSSIFWDVALLWSLAVQWVCMCNRVLINTRISFNWSLIRFNGCRHQKQSDLLRHWSFSFLCVVSVTSHTVWPQSTNY